ncbi:MAG: NUDIX domain-containing protein [Oscillospiraceae bacterium]|nr:NUDIX domain-containing protein [Oscillospiraceae bacterium]
MKLNVIIVYGVDEKNILMCLRSKDPYKGLYNLVGGKIETGEDGLESAYRELEEETGITKKDIILTHLMDFMYHMSNVELQVYVGKLNKEVELTEEANKLFWINADDNFYDTGKYAGEGNIGHMLEQVRYYKARLLV